MPTVQKKVQENFSRLQSFYTGTGGGTPVNQVDSDDHKFRQVNAPRSRADVPNLTQDRQGELSLFLYQSNPFAHRYVELMTAFTMGDGPTPLAADPDVQALLDDFWYNDHNDWPSRAIQFARDLSIYGEQSYMVGAFDEDDDFLVGMQHLSPQDIKTAIQDRFDKYTIDAIKLYPKVLEGVTRDSDPRLIIPVVRERERGQDGKRRLNGDAFFFKINQAGEATRGLSDLFSLIDWLQIYGQYQFNLAERLAHLTMYFFDVELQNADENDIRKFKRDILRSPPEPGALVVHNDQATLEAKSVNLGDADLVEVGQAFESAILTGLGIPPHWTATPSQGGRSVAEAANDPVFRHMSLRQSTQRKFISKIIRFQIDQAIRLGVIEPKSEEFKLVFPKLGLRDFQRAGGTAARIAQSLKDSVEAGLIPQEMATKLLFSAFDQVGLSANDITQAEQEPTSEGKNLLASIEESIDTCLHESKLPDDKTKEQVADEWRRLMLYHLSE